MSKSAMIEEESAWAQTFVTVTPQDDGFLREIDENSIVSGTPDVQLNLDTWNIVLRKSLMNTTKDLINLGELDKSERISSDAQTYLQGVPRVELPLVYRDEATQTLYIGRDGPEANMMRAFDDIMTVMNEKPLPEWKKSQMVQTTITFDREPPYDVLVEQLKMEVNSGKMVQESEEKNALMEVMDLLNFIMERTFWMSDPVAVPKREAKDAEATTVIKYNHETKKLTFDNEVQTYLSCEPSHSNSMLLAEYNEAKGLCRKSVEECMEKGVYPRIVVENVVKEIVEKSRRQIDFPIIEKYDTKREEAVRPIERSFSIYRCPCRPPTDEKSPRRTENILLTDNRSYVVRSRAAAVENPFLKPACSSNVDEISIIPDARSIASFRSIHKSLDSPTFQMSKRSLQSRDKEALDILRSTFCRPETCPNRQKSIDLASSKGRRLRAHKESLDSKNDHLPYSRGWRNFDGAKRGLIDAKTPQIEATPYIPPLDTDLTIEDLY